MRFRPHLLGWLAVLALAAPPGLAQIAALEAVVGVAARVPPDARTARFLGRHRFGTGVVIDGDGLVVTVGYLLLEATEAKLVLSEERIVAADVLAYDQRSGLGLLRAREPLAITPLPLGDDRPLSAGAPLLVASYGGESALRPGVLVKRREFAGYWEFLLEDALVVSPPHRRFAGAALIDTSGQLVGIGALLVSGNQSEEEPLPAAIFSPVSLLREVLPDLLAHGRSDRPPRPWLGLYLSEREGIVRVMQVADEGPALAAGLEVGDVIVAIDGVSVHSLAALYRRLWASGRAGVRVSLDALRGATPLTLEVTTGDRYAWLRVDASR